jgi:hypothetical protein
MGEGISIVVLSVGRYLTTTTCLLGIQFLFTAPGGFIGFRCDAVRDMAIANFALTYGPGTHWISRTRVETCSWSRESNEASHNY